MSEFRPDPFDRPAPQPAPEGGLIGRRLVLALVGLGAVAVAAAGIWFAYDQGVKRGAGGGPMLIKADNGPVKTAPENPGGMQVPNQDKQVFERLTGRQMGQGNAPVENLLPPPEQPMPQAPAAPEPAPPVVAALPPTTPQAAVPATPPAPGQQAAPAPAAAPPAAAKPPAVAAAPLTPVTPAAPAAQPAPAATPAPAPVPGQQQTAAAGPRQLTVPTTPAPAPAAPAATTAAATPAPKAASPAPPGSGNYRLQLSSVRSEADADKEWRRLKGKYPDPLNALASRYTRVDLGDKGIWWRVQTGPVGDRTAADAACAKLKSQGQGCSVVQ